MITVSRLKSIIDLITKEKEPEYNKILESLGKYNALGEISNGTRMVDRYFELKKLSNSIEIYITKYKNSPKNKILNTIKIQCKNELHTILSYSAKPVKKEVIVLDIEFDFKEFRESQMNFWKTLNPDYNFNLYYDSEAFAFNVLSHYIQRKAGEEAIREIQRENGNEFFITFGSMFGTKRMKNIFKIRKELKKLFEERRAKKPNVKPSYVIKEFISNSKDHIRGFDNFRKEYKRYYESLGAKDVRSKDLNLTKHELFKTYEKEMFFRTNQFDATNILKLLLLNKRGGVVLDTTFLPSIKKEVFSNIQLPSNLSRDDMESLKLIAIMKEKAYIKGYDQKLIKIELYDGLSDNIKAQIRSELASVNSPSELFHSLGEFNVSELAFLSNIRPLGNVNPVIVAHQNSLGSEFILDQIKTRYSIIHKFYDEIEEKNDSYFVALRDVVRRINETKEMQMKTFLLSTKYYMETGLINLQTHYIPSSYISGNGVLISTMQSIVDFNKTLNIQVGKLTDNTYRQFLLSEEKVVKNTQLALFKHQALFSNRLSSSIFELTDSLGITIKKSEEFDQKKALDLQDLKNLCNADKRFNYQKDYVNIILQIQNDIVTHSILKRQFAKYAENSIAIQTNLDGMTMYYYDPNTKEVMKEPVANGLPEHLKNFEKMKLSILGHGSPTTVGDKLPHELLYYLVSYMKTIKGMFPVIKKLEINLLACTTITLGVPLEYTFPGNFLTLIRGTNNPIKEMVNSKIENISVTTSPYPVGHLNERFSVTEDKTIFFNREEANLRGMTPKYVVKYEKGQLTLKPKEIKKSFDLRNGFAHNIVDIDAPGNVPSVGASASTSESLAEDLGIALDFEDIALTSITSGQDRDYEFLSEIQKDTLDIYDYLKIAENLSQDIYEIKDSNELGEEHIALLDSIEEDGENHFIKFISKESGEEKKILIDKESFLNYKAFSEEKIKPVVDQLSNLLKDDFVYDKDIVGESIHTSTISAAFFIQTLLQYIKTEKDISDLGTSVQVQIYTQMASTALNTVLDGSNIVRVVRQIEDTSFEFLPRLFHSIQFLSTILDGVNLGASIYQLVHTDDEFERKILESNIGLTSVNLATGLGATTSYLIGASTVAEVFGVLAVPLIGITIGLGSLVENILKIEYDAGQVVEFFRQLGKIKENGYYRLTQDKKAAIPSPLAPIEKIDLKNKNITFGDIKISKTHGGSIVKNNPYPLFFASPEMDNRNEGISISDVLFTKTSSQPALDCETIILPSAANVRYFAEQSWVFGSATWRGEGVNVLNTLRKHYDRKFTWRCYVFGGERALSKLKPEYSNTNVDIYCDGKDRTFVSAITDKKLAEKLSYNVYYDNSKYTYVLQHTPIPVSFMPIDDKNKKSVQFNIKVSNVVYKTELVKGKLERTSHNLKKLGDVIKFSNVTEKNGKKSLEVEVCEQKLKFYGITSEDKIFLSFDSKEFEMILKVDVEKLRLEKLIIIGDMEEFTSDKLNFFEYLNNYNLPSYILENIDIILNQNFGKNKQEPMVTGSLNVLKNEYSILTKKLVEGAYKYSHIIKDSTLSTSEVIINITNEDTTVIKKWNDKLNKNDYFIKGASIPKVEIGVLRDVKQKENEFWIQILERDKLLLKNVFLIDSFTNEVLNILEGTPTLFEEFNFKTKVDPKTKDGKEKIISALTNIMIKNVIGNSISIENVSNLKIELSQKTFISGVDGWNRNLRFNLTDKTDYNLEFGSWSNNKNNIDFNYNVLNKNELFVTKQKDATNKNNIKLEALDITKLEDYVKYICVMCNSKTEELDFTEFKFEEIEELNILLQNISISNDLNIKLPFNIEDLSWNSEDSSFALYYKDKKINILDLFNLDHTDKKILLTLKDKKSIDLITFMKTYK